ncbi:hypothetical protein E4634_07195 [Mangrovimicrobium sediminis]|uniref:Uncharacterized protein n=1 Tax=Mangrovimicrobium sediminis TaxID=2562682 RepID=A0A4Z0M399_9GAMM|nr:hypothetical protein [Haliea sp. SAOS-164]TGD73920.1 hypothetical protein E4634_07195 [Haliea sp. SAOS-164]
MFTLVMRELQEYRLSLVWTPLIAAGLVVFLMLLGVVFGARIAAFSGGVWEMVVLQDLDVHPAIVINVEDDSAGGLPEAPLPPGAPDPDGALDVQSVPADSALPEESWNFSREWRFEPERSDSEKSYEPEVAGSLNPLLAVPHLLLMVILIIVTVNYLLGSMYNDRKDRSILFWKSMPVSEWEEVLTRLGVALIVAPAIYIGISLLLQFLLLLLSMLMVWRLGADPFVEVLANVQMFELFAREVGGWVMTALWIVPTYGWLLLASSWAKRTPSFAAIVPMLVLLAGEQIIFGTDFVEDAVKNHLPYFIGGNSPEEFWFSMGVQAGPGWLSLVLGLVFAAATLAGAVYLRRYRFEI